MSQVLQVRSNYVTWKLIWTNNSQLGQAHSNQMDVESWFDTYEASKIACPSKEPSESGRDVTQRHASGRALSYIRCRRQIHTHLFATGKFRGVTRFLLSLGYFLVSTLRWSLMHAAGAVLDPGRARRHGFVRMRGVARAHWRNTFSAS